MIFLAGAKVEKARVFARAAIVQARMPGKTWWIVLVADGKRGAAGVTDARPKTVASDDAEIVKANARAKLLLEGATVARVEASSAVFARETTFVRVAARADRVVLEEMTAAELAALPEAAPMRTEDEAAWVARGRELAETVATAALEEERRALSRALKTAAQKIERRAAAVRSDLERIRDAQGFAALAASFVAEAAKAPRGARSLTIVDWSTGEAREVTMELDPSKPARVQLEAKFARAKRMKQGAVLAEKRLADANAALAALDGISNELAAGAADVPALRARAKAAAGRDFALATATTSAARSREERRRPYRLFLGARDAKIFVGRGGADNDELTLRVSRPHDLWLHAKNKKGAHVIVPLDKGKTCPPDVLADAAHLAAHFSDARDEGVVEIEHAERRHVRKPRGSAPGFVVVEREKVLVLRVDRARLADLLAREQ